MDRRIARTRKSIKRAFAYLLSQKDLNEITITDIANAADVNRKTFYTYFEKKCVYLHPKTADR